MVDGFPFVAGATVYIIRGRDDLKIARLDDGGMTWTEATPLQTGRKWYSYSASIVYANDRIYLVRECRTEPILHGYPAWILAPVVPLHPLTHLRCLCDFSSKGVVSS